MKCPMSDVYVIDFISFLNYFPAADCFFLCNFVSLYMVWWNTILVIQALYKVQQDDVFNNSGSLPSFSKIMSHSNVRPKAITWVNKIQIKHKYFSVFT